MCIDYVRSLRFGQKLTDQAAIAQRMSGDAVKKTSETCLADSLSPGLSHDRFCRVENLCFMFGSFEERLGSSIASIDRNEKASVKDHEKKRSISVSSAAVEGPASATQASTNSLMASRRAVSSRKRSRAMRTNSDLPP